MLPAIKIVVGLLSAIFLFIVGCGMMDAINDTKSGRLSYIDLSILIIILGCSCTFFAWLMIRGLEIVL